MSDYTDPFSTLQAVDRAMATPMRRYSVTADVLSFRRCRRQYGFEAVHGYQPSRTSQVYYGTVIHQVLDRAHAHYHGMIDPNTKGQFPADEDIDGYFDEVSQSLKTRGIRGARAAVEEQARNVLKIFNTVEGPTLYPRVVDSEHRMQANETEYVLHGTVDLLVAPGGDDEGPASLEIWDYKGLRRPRDNDPRLVDFRFQMMVYADLYRRRHGVYPARARLYFMNELAVDSRTESANRDAALLTVEFTPSDVAAALESFRQSVRTIEDSRANDNWSAPAVGQGPGEETCSICDFRWNCPTVRNDAVLNRRIPIRHPGPAGGGFA